jgi:hypothetical protein
MIKILSFIAFLFTINAHAQTSSVKATDEGFTIDQMVILKNKNLPSFIKALQSSRLSLSHKVDIPDFIKPVLNQLSKDEFTIANPNADWNCCDGSWDEKLPNRQLIFQAKSKNLFLIYYLKGGIGVNQNLILINYQNNTILDFWKGTFLSKLKTQNDIIRYLIANKNKHWGLNTNIIYY